MIDALARALEELARRREIISYGALARQLEIVGPASIARLTAALEATMAQDTAQGRPLRAALCYARGSDLPAKGFFETARHLGVDFGPEPAAFVAAQREKLFTAS
ncbi:hypothetical protein SAMN05216227_100781 [Pseudorhodobacter antarcticus]|jgi:hypothetical protein|uniref:Uncharacterized protein n=1 Tax=Pseudorhodobacter antarcticus TaxID=1077947 RepID=A0A1H8DPE9_9RHOB|nr:hypothetical protein [Pseudorhodobacter antarcticus]SEN09035.1 hypothetical protein SAMN05216227_100781 [Pseudorhodobacter antarcticus]